MTIFHKAKIVAAVLLATVCISKTSAQDATRPIPLVLPAAEEMGRGPSHIFFLRDGLLGIVDPIGKRIAFVDDSRKILGSLPLPNNFSVSSVAPVPNGVTLRAQDGRQLLIRSDVDPKQPQISTPRAGPKSAPIDSYVVRTDRKTMQLLPTRANQKVIEIRSITGGEMAEIENLGSDQSGNRYVLWSEITAVQPELKVETFVWTLQYEWCADWNSARALGRYGSGAKSSGFGYAKRRAQDFDSGKVGRGNLRLFVQADYREPSGRYAQRTRNLKSLGDSPADSVQSIDSKVSKPGTVQQNFRWPPEGKGTRSAKPLKEITRLEVLKNARAFIGVQWTPATANIENPQIPNDCEKESGRYWQRPSFLTSASVGKIVSRIPYNWGGFDSPESFTKKMSQGKLAGNVCTCREQQYDYCFVAEAAGVDCSGFVSRAWGLPDHAGTSELTEDRYSKPITSIFDVKPADAFDRPGNHVRLVYARLEGANLSFIILELTTKSECEGVCEWTYTAKELAGYKPICYKLVREFTQ